MTTPYQQAAAQELLRRQNALNSLTDYRSYIAPSGELDFKHAPAAHHQVLIRALHDLERGHTDDGRPVRRLLVMMPPGSAKSTYCSVQFATWYLARHPQHAILACSNTTELAENFNRRRRNVCLSKQWQALSETALNERAMGVGRFENNVRGSITASGVGSSIVGLRADLLILDDPIQSFEQAMSGTQLEKIWAWYETDARSRLLPTGKELIVTTRWARKDPAGRILELIESGAEKDWLVLRLPMLADRIDDPMGRALDAPLWPEWFTQLQIEQNIRSPLRWCALYQQVPLDDAGTWVHPDCIQYVDEVPEDLNHVVAMDLALSTGKGDFTVFVVAGLDVNRDLYVVDVQRHQYTPDNAVHVLFRLAREYELFDCLLDDDPATKVFASLFRELAKREDGSFPTTLMPTRGKDKETRAAAIRGFFQQRRVFIKRAPWNAELHAEIYGFPNAEHDDQIDCLSLIGRRMATMSAPSRRDDSPLLKQIITLDANGKFILNKTLDEMFDERRQRSSIRTRI